MAIDFKQKLSNAGDILVNALLGTPVQAEPIEPTYGYSPEIEKAKNSLGNLASVQNMLKQPNALSLEQIQRDFTQGLNNGNADIAKLQDDLKIAKPVGKMNIELAQNGQFNLPNMISAGTSNAPRQGGFLNDLVSGYRENVSNGFEVDNLAPNENKGLATRIGEGLGSLVRFYDKPIGRMVAATGLSMLTDEVNPLQEGVTAYVGRQTNLTKDKAYRQNLQQMGYTQDEIDSIPGMVTDEVYGNLIRAQQLKDNAEYRNMLLKTEQATKADALRYQKMRDIKEDAYTDRKLDIEERKLEQKDNKNKNTVNLQAVNTQLDRFQNTFKDMPGKLESNTLGRARAVTGLQTAQEANFNSQRQLLFNKIARDLGGEKGVLSDQDIKRIEGALPSYTDSLEQKNAKMEAIYDLLNDRLSAEGGSLQDTTTAQTNNGLVRVKAPNGKIGTIPAKNLDAALAKGYTRL